MYYMQDTVKHFCHYAHSFVTCVAMPSVFFFFFFCGVFIYLVFHDFIILSFYMFSHTSLSFPSCNQSILHSCCFYISLERIPLLSCYVENISCYFAHQTLYSCWLCYTLQRIFLVRFYRRLCFNFFAFFNIFRLVLEIILKCATKQIVSELAAQF